MGKGAKKKKSMDVDDGAGFTYGVCATQHWEWGECDDVRDKLTPCIACGRSSGRHEEKEGGQAHPKATHTEGRSSDEGRGAR